MLRALKQQLIQLSEEGKEPFLAILKKKVGSSQAKVWAGPLKNFILVLPEMIAQVRIWSDTKDLSEQIHNLNGNLLTYLYHPADFLHDEGYGLFGYLDDAYLVGSVYHTTLRALGPENSQLAPHQAEIAAQVETWLDVTRRVIPKETALIEKMKRDLSMGNLDILRGLLERPPSSRPVWPARDKEIIPVA